MNTTKAQIDNVLFADNRILLEVIPEAPADTLDRFIFSFLHQLAINNMGSGFHAIQASAKLDILRNMSWQQMRDVAAKSPDFPVFERTATEGV